MVREAGITLPFDEPDTVRKDMAPFYNSAMRTNRDISVLTLAALDDLDAVFPLAGSGIRALRAAQETTSLSSCVVNDINENFPRRFTDYADQNSLDPDQFIILSQDARTLCFDLRSYDYVELDPFGSPNTFLDPAIQELRDGGVIAVTATDTAPLSGTYPTTCERNYWATPCLNHEMHEFGLRILIRKAQLVAAQHERALTPLLSYASNHYFKVVLRCQKSKQRADDVLDQHQRVERGGETVGPLWTGKLWSTEFLQGLIDAASQESEPNSVDIDEETNDLLETLIEESKTESLGFYDVHELSGELGLGGPPAIDDVLSALHDDGERAVRTHFTPTGIRTSASKEGAEAVLRRVATG